MLDNLDELRGSLNAVKKNTKKKKKKRPSHENGKQNVDILTTYEKKNENIHTEDKILLQIVSFKNYACV